MNKTNLSKINIVEYKTRDDVKFKKVYDEWDRLNSKANRCIFIIDDVAFEKFKIRQAELKLKKQLEDISYIKQHGYVGCVGLAGRL